MPFLRWLLWPVALFALTGLFVGAYLIHAARKAELAEEGRDAVKSPARKKGRDIVLHRTDAEESGLAETPAQAAEWSEPIRVYGRLIPNPRASAVLLAPVAGMLESPEIWPSLGASVRADQTLGTLRLRVGTQERLELRLKLEEARARKQGTEKLVAILTERLTRLEKSSVVSQREVEDVRVTLTEARTSLTVAQQTQDILQQASDALEQGGSLGIYRVPVTSPVEGEVIEVPVRPGVAVEAGTALLRIVDFRRPLAQLEIPADLLAEGLPPRLDLGMLPTSPGRKEANGNRISARLVGPTPHVDSASPFISCRYEADLQATAQGSLAAGWRPGRFVFSDIPSRHARKEKVVAVPAEALLVHQGRTLAYVLEKETVTEKRYERREVRVIGREGDLAYLASGVRAGEPVVHRQAQLLLAEEFRGTEDD